MAVFQIHPNHQSKLRNKRWKNPGSLGRPTQNHKVWHARKLWSVDGPKYNHSHRIYGGLSWAIAVPNQLCQIKTRSYPLSHRHPPPPHHHRHRHHHHVVQSIIGYVCCLNSGTCWFCLVLLIDVLSCRYTHMTHMCCVDQLSNSQIPIPFRSLPKLPVSFIYLRLDSQSLQQKHNQPSW